MGRIRWLHPAAGLAGFALLLCWTSLPAVAQDTLTADDILHRVAVTYSESNSYSDMGQVKTVLFFKSGNEVVQRSFQTAFVRPGQFRFDFSYQHESPGSKGPERHYILWRDGKDVRLWDDVLRVKETVMDSLQKAVSAYAGVSAGTSDTISALLLPDELNRPALMDHVWAQRIDDATTDDVDCYRLQGKLRQSTPTTVWIEKATWLVRRIDSKIASPPGEGWHAEQTITYTPVLNGAVTEAMLEYKPPKTQ